MTNACKTKDNAKKTKQQQRKNCRIINKTNKKKTKNRVATLSVAIYVHILQMTIEWTLSLNEHVGC